MLRLRRTTIRARALVGWTLTLFVVSQLALGMFLDRAHPELCDPEYGSLLHRLQDRLVEAPGRPLVLVLGSSRFANAFWPGAVPADTHAPAVFFNFATVASGPVRQLLMFRRLLDRGVRAACVVAEVWPPYLTQRKSFAEDTFILDHDLMRSDRPLLGRYVADAEPGQEKILEGECVPAWAYRRYLLARCLPFRGPAATPSPFDWTSPYWRTDPCGWLPCPVPRPGPELFRRYVTASAEHVRSNVEDFAVADTADRALRELLEACAGRGVRVALVLLPEHSILRGLFPQRAHQEVATYLGGLSLRYGVPVIDARAWVADDDFIDMTHVVPAAAGPFSARLGQTVLWPLLEGRPPDGAALYPRVPPAYSTPWPGEAQ
jgi:hypothetical protein